MKRLICIWMLCQLVQMCIAHEVLTNGLVYKLDERSLSASVVGRDSTSSDLLERISIPETLAYEGAYYRIVSIEDGAFANCKELLSIELPKSVLRLGNGCFADCSKLESIKLPKQLKAIGNYCFGGCSLLTEVIIPKHVERIGEQVFQCCTNLRLVSIPSSVKEIGEQCFERCPSLPVYNSIRYAGNFAVEVVDKTLVSYSIRRGTRFLDLGLFGGCKNLIKLKIPKSVRSIGTVCFGGCERLESINIPEGVERIPSELFVGCSSLSSVTFPKTTKKVGNVCFDKNSGLSSLYCKAAVPPSVDHIPFAPEFTKQCILYVPHAALDEYKASPEWRRFVHIEGF